MSSTRWILLGLAALCLLGCQRAASPISGKPVTMETVVGMREIIRIQVAGGFLQQREIVEYVVGAFSDEHRASELRPHAIGITSEFLQEHKKAQESWPAVTDCDRLDSAFAELNKDGIVARQNFTDCQTCGNAEILDEMEKAAERGIEVRGYTYYHQQDTEAAVEGQGIWLAYGSIEDDTPSAIKVGREVVAMLKKHGLHAKWNGTFERRIEVPMNWKRRRH